MSSTKWLPFCLGLNVLTAPESWVSTSWQLAHLLCLWRLYTSVNFHFFPNAASQRSVLASYMLHSSETSLITRSMGPTWGPPGSCRPPGPRNFVFWDYFDFARLLGKYITIVEIQIGPKPISVPGSLLIPLVVSTEATETGTRRETGS